ncbi:other/IKS protein kinase [Lactarius indigo]|nr:other/IKS protein kinase [Lactarius indigo]
MTSLQVRDRPEWQPILHSSNQVVLYNPTSHALIIHPSSQSENRTVTLDQSVPHLCPYCSRPLPPGPTERDDVHEPDSSFTHLSRFEDVSEAHASNYFQLLQVANESASRPPSPPLHSTHSPPSSQTNTRAPSPSNLHDDNVFSPESMAEGYFKAFFQEEARLGMGANGTVFLCQHVLNGNPLGHFAVKKIAVGQSASYLLKILREVHLLETLRHPNIITYHHAWLETAQFSTFGPKIPTLHVLMQWAEGGSLDDYIDARLGRPTHLPHPASNDASTDDDDTSSEVHSRSARIRAFRAMQRAAPSEKSALRAKLNDNGHSWTAVHLLSAEEVLGIFGGVAAGLGFLHDKSILHLDLKPGNVLLTWDEGALIPRAMLSDFGTSRDMLQMPRARSGNTGTLEYSSPESLPVPPHNALPQTDSKSDMWSLGMILHKLIFFRLPYRWAAYGDRPLDGFSHASPHEDSGKGNDMDRLEREVSSYPGFKSTPRLETLFASRRLPRSYLVLLESLLNVSPVVRPSCEKVLAALHLGKFNPIQPKSSLSDVLASRTVQVSDTTATSSLVPALRLPKSTSPPSSPTLPQITPPPSVPVSRPAPLPDSSAEKKRLPSPTRSRQGRWFMVSQQTSTRVLRVLKSGILALKISSLCINKEALPLWALSMLAGLSIVVDSLSDDVTLNLGMGIVHFAVLKTWR